ncbi:MAG: DUF4175 domain-containing protein [Flavobacteriales bacterium]|nr:DUF4175 domain-containing protein [Flavobacteriales bacterium]
MATNYDFLVDKLDSFIRKYYKNKILRGIIYSAGILVGFFLVVALLEYFGRFGTAVRTALFWSLILIAGYVIAKYILYPLIKLYRLGKVISYDQASMIIGTHFGEVQDKLLNTLQLKRQSEMTKGDISLLNASIDQKADELSPIPFNNAIDLGSNKRYLKYAIPPLAILLVILFAAPSVIKDSTTRLVQHNQDFIPQAPFDFKLLNEDLRVASQEDLELKLKLVGEAYPSDVRLVIGNSTFRMVKESPMDYRYVIKNLQDNETFLFEADGFRSRPYSIEVLPKPLLLGFQVTLDYPRYTGLKDEVLRNSGDLSVPIGTRAKWSFDTKDTDDLLIHFQDSTYRPDSESRGLFIFNSLLTNSSSYTVSTKNKYLTNPDSIRYAINVIPDLYPEIAIREQRDSINDKNLYFQGQIRDDYGFSGLAFNYTIQTNRTDSAVVKGLQRTELPFSGTVSAERFYHSFSLDELDIKAGDVVNYYFEVWDNDGFSGAKSSRSQTLRYEAPSLEELAQMEESANQEIKETLEKSIKDAQELQKDVDELRRDLLEKKELDWQDKKKIEKLLEEQKKLEKQVQQAQQRNEQNVQQQQQYEDVSEKILQKQQQLQELFEQVMSPEMQEMMAELQRLMEELDPDKLEEQLEQMELSNEDIESELDRNLELFKQLEFEIKAEEIQEKLDELAEKQEALAEETEKGEKSQEELKEEQDELKEEYKEIQDELEKLSELNEELEEKNDLDMMGLDEEVAEDMENSSDSIENGENQDASDSQQDASDKMQQMSQMMSAMSGSSAEQQQEDMDALRALLENIIELSFDQEEVMRAYGGLETDDPKYKAYNQQQRKLKDDAVVVKDSLLALSKRIAQIQPIVNKEINSVNQNMDKAIELLADRQTPKANSRQQYVMTSLNNLALLLDEALQQMQQQMANSMPGSGNCEKPGGSGKGKPKSGKGGSMSQMQKAMQKKLEQLQKGMTPGQGKAGPGRFGMSEQLARTAAEQAAIRRELERMSQELNKDGSGAGNEIKEIAKQMEETEKDIVNMQITRQTLQRQQDILTRLLKSEKAEREREQDNKRISNEATDYDLSSPENFFEYQKAREKEVELLRTIPPSLKPYYKNKVNEYFLNFDQP